MNELFKKILYKIDKLFKNLYKIWKTDRFSLSDLDEP